MSKSTAFTPQAGPSREQVREQIRQTIVEQRKAIEQATQDAQRQIEGKTEVIQLPAPPLPPEPPTFPGTAVPQFDPNQIPPQVESISIAFFAMVAVIIIGLPIMRAIARRIDRGTPPPQNVPAELREEIHQMSQSIDAIAVEVERISENQRFTTRLLTEKAKVSGQ
ncbi:MAG TPA: hypothetical protein VM939_15545 [Gemmatimonadaceae bacterium]|nr:hypothetical protein [Gemmatimonadaceae bacterium]